MYIRKETKKSHPSSPQSDASLSVRLRIKKIFQAFNLRQVKSTIFKSTSGELSGLSRSTEFETRESGEYRRDDSATRVKM
jgi:hypothetical protein